MSLNFQLHKILQNNIFILFYHYLHGFSSYAGGNVTLSVFLICIFIYIAATKSKKRLFYDN